MPEETIAAISTAFGEGGIGIVRISGESARAILETIFVPIKKQNRMAQEDAFLPAAECVTIGMPIVNRRLTYGTIVDPDNGKVLDEVLAVFMKGPYTYTTEDIAEINCHGSVVSLRKVLDLVLRKGARLAEPGEFTKRAFLNGRLDLTQAEAVIDVITAKTEKTFDLALDQMGGALFREVKEIRGALMDVLVDVTVNIDYPDEDIEELTYDHLNQRLLEIGDMIREPLSTADAGRLIREGISVVIAGKPNVGKSSLMNGLLRESRAIVTDIPGTTRDTIEEVISIRDLPVRLTDTAGIRSTEDKIESIGIEKSKESFNKADLIILMLDGSEALSAEDKEIISYIGRRNTIVLINKSDLGEMITEGQVRSLIPGEKVQILSTAISRGEGITEIEDRIAGLIYGGKVVQKDSLLITNARHADLLRKAASSISDALAMAERREALDFIQLDIQNCYDFLGEIIGETASDDLINEVFARFCLGK